MKPPSISPKTQPLPVVPVIQRKIKSLPLVKTVLSLLDWQWWIIIPLGMSILVLETIEHWDGLLTNQDVGFFYAEVGLLLLMVIITEVLISTLTNILADRARSNNLLLQKHNLNLRLTTALDLTGIENVLTQFVQSVEPNTSMALFVYDGYQHKLRRIGSPGTSQATVPLQMPGDLSGCVKGLVLEDTTLEQIEICPLIGYHPAQNGQRAYCLPLRYGAKLIGLIHLFLPVQKTFRPEQSELFEQTSNDIANVLQAMIEKKSREEISISEATSNLKLEFARDLHDTLGQNISYMRMKLEQLNDNDQLMSEKLQKEVRRMYDAANETYDLMRGTLAFLKTNDSMHLGDMLADYARQVSERSGIQIPLKASGQETRLRPRAVRQIFFMFRESLNNVEKHSGASHVLVDLEWETDQLVLKITDNGKGMDPEHAEIEQHYGLRFMRERATHLNGDMVLWSQPGKGTCLTFTIPVEPETDPSGD